MQAHGGSDKRWGAFEISKPAPRIIRLSNFVGVASRIGVLLLGLTTWVGVGASATLAAGPKLERVAEKPRAIWKPIPFGPERRAQMTKYSLEHYGPRWADWRLTDPKVIVEHYTASNSMMSAWYTFESNSPKLGQLPGTCAHFIVDTDGAIYQLVPLDTRCRHTTGLNHRSIGIEMVGTSDWVILRNPRQSGAAIRLTSWLQGRFGIRTRDVIGHSESLNSPYRLELYGPWKTQTHGDWSQAAMVQFRKRLADS